MKKVYAATNANTTPNTISIKTSSPVKTTSTYIQKNYPKNQSPKTTSEKTPLFSFKNAIQKILKDSHEPTHITRFSPVQDTVWAMTYSILNTLVPIQLNNPYKTVSKIVNAPILVPLLLMKPIIVNYSENFLNNKDKTNL